MLPKLWMCSRACVFLFLIWVILSSWVFLSLPSLAANTDLCGERVLIPGGSFTMGDSSPLYAEEQAAEDVTVTSFCIDRHEVTNAQFSAFIEATGYVTVAEQPLPKDQFPALSAQERAPGSLVFIPPADPDQRLPYLSWWHWVKGADWRHPYGPNSDIRDKADHPVVHIAYEDAVAYANWMGGQLPTEAQWEYAARGGLDSKTYTWGDQYSAQKANTWQGLFPFFNTQEDGFISTAPVMSFPANGYGLFDMTGNVWEWTSDWYNPSHHGKIHQTNPTGPLQQESFDPKKPMEGAVHVIKGGSHLCARNYCSRYRPAARESQSPDTGTTHIGFRLVRSIPMP